MKNNILSLAVLFLLAAAFSSCKKDPSFNEQLVGNWISVKVKAGNEDLTATNSFNLELQQSHEFNLDLVTMPPLAGKITQSFTGDWSGDSGKQDITLNYSDGETKTWDVTAIGETELTAEMVENNIRFTVTFQKQ